MPILIQGDVKRFLAGTVTANGTTAVSITIPNLAEDTLILTSLKTAAGTPEALYEFSRTVSTGVVEFKSAASNTSVYNVYAFA
ncbi:hypothetical protein UFOVP826_56 [uncultured Caudovirales phage]|uniref:Uncharacterized protein n=1 Tax=uncultured Caudovirales phage TaxID=2100421 RepID=A0A6J5P671_9CAUD|nr:hypothetical protein UFOVP826_56 [uncultured Caudovirales phage]